jgi:hypothetical protein
MEQSFLNTFIILIQNTGIFITVNEKCESAQKRDSNYTELLIPSCQDINQA